MTQEHHSLARPLRVGLVGTGYIADFHARAIKELKGVELAAVADANVETVLIVDLDLTNLAQQRDVATVRHLYDRRSDLYEVRAKRQVKVVRTD